MYAQNSILCQFGPRNLSPVQQLISPSILVHFWWELYHIYAATQQGHGATSTQAAGIHVGQVKTNAGEGGGSSAEQGGDVVAGDMVPAGAHNEGAKGGCQSKARGAEVLDSANE